MLRSVPFVRHVGAAALRRGAPSAARPARVRTALPRLALAAALAVIAWLAAPAPAHGYEFEVRARTFGQGINLRSFRLLSRDLVITRRHIAQSLSLYIWDLGRPRGLLPLWDSRPRVGPRLSLVTSLRIDHGFGDWTGGGVIVGNRILDAVDAVPELEPDLVNLDVLQAYFAAEGLVDGTVDLYIGRQLSVDSLSWWSMDGVTARVHTPLAVTLEAFGGLRVRDASPVGGATTEPDGTGGGECAEYVEGTVPGSGAWRPIDLGPLVPSENRLFENDLDRCPQREQIMPTFGGAIETRSPLPVWGRLSYRRSVSPTPGLIGPADRFAFQDVGYYPNELRQAPDWATNEEYVTASARATIPLGRGGSKRDGALLVPQAAARYSVLHGLVDEAHAGLVAQLGAHSIAPEIYYARPTFDGDSIFNVFAIEPYTDVRLTYDLTPRKWPVSAWVRGWVRRFSTEGEPAEVPADPADPEAPPEPGDIIDQGDVAGGVQLGARYTGRRLQLRLDLFSEGGYGGDRTGGFATAGWHATRTTRLRLRTGLVHVHDDAIARLEALTATLQAGASFELFEGVGIHLAVEENHNRFFLSQFRVIGVLDLAFNPET